jgi:predicted naringenin-chalcone synthase
MEQIAISRWMSEALVGHPAVARWLSRVYANSGIDARYTCLPDGFRPPHESAFSPALAPTEAASTADRMAIYQREAVPLGANAARTALLDYATAHDLSYEQAAGSITHLIAVSCTGFFAPGLDYALMRQLQLKTTVERTLIGFMGCFAAFNALRLASQIVAGRPDARVLVVCVELSSIHVQPGIDREQLIGGSLFADGAAACVVSIPTNPNHDVFMLDAFHTDVKPDSEQDMAWQIGNNGFLLRLSPRVPDQLAAVAPAAVTQLFAAQRPAFWAIHPGGRAIVDRLTELFNLMPTDVTASRNILRQYGNLSSPTILFVLRELREQFRQSVVEQPQTGIAMAFGPGLTLEMARLTYQPAELLQLGTREVARATVA